jgi:long-chain acyl-CoA synthetase
MLGYWRQAEATRNCLIGGRFHTGDLGSMDADGFLYFVDRLKDVISVHGYKVYILETLKTRSANTRP